MILLVMDVLLVGNEVHSNSHKKKRFIYRIRIQGRAGIEATLDHCLPFTSTLFPWFLCFPLFSFIHVIKSANIC